METAIAQACGLTKIYRMGRTQVHALRGIDLTIARGEFIAIMGRSGSGKSTLLNLLGCLDTPTSGTVTIDGLDVGKVPRHRLHTVRRTKLGFVFQQFNLLPGLTAVENVVLPLRYAGVPGSDRQKRAREALERVGLGDRLHHRPSELSGGEQQRVALARAIVNHPALVLADEPTGELDTHTAAEIMALLREFNRDQGLTFLIVTHDPAVGQATDRVLRMQDGVIVGEEHNHLQAAP